VGKELTELALCAFGPASLCPHLQYARGQTSKAAAFLAPFLPARAGAVTWGTAAEVPGLAALSSGHGAQVTSVSCASAGNCAAGGRYDAATPGDQAFVADVVNGTWHHAIKVPGIAALNTAGLAQVTSVSCGSAGNCAAAGQYDSKKGYQAFVADEVNGTWHDAIEVPGTAALNTGGGNGTEVTSVSCAPAGNCAAGGRYDSTKGYQAFVADEVNGTWHDAAEVPGTAALNTGGGYGAAVTSVSCASAGNCAAGGYYTDSSGLREQVLVASEVNGTWRPAAEIPGLAALSTFAGAEAISVSCASAGNCAAGGSFTDASDQARAFLVDEVNGTWRAAVKVPGLAALNAGGGAAVNSVSCRSAGNCAAGGSYLGGSGRAQAFVADEVDGAWRDAAEIPGAVALNAGGYAVVLSVSCASAGNCAAGGQYQDSTTGYQAFVAAEVNGAWHDTVEVPGTAALNGNFAEVTSMSCTTAGSCAAGGFYSDSADEVQAFITSP
jgi:hypothetical protein